jgi:hypothetical protein
MNAPPLAGPIAKIERAKTQIDELNTKINEFFGSRPYESASKINAKRTEEVWRFRINPIPTEFTVRVGEILHNLRSALDQMACAIALQHSGTTKGTYFPFGATAEIFEKELARKGKKLPPAAKTMIRALKPYKRGNKLLWEFHDFNRGDKHVALVAINLAVTVKMSYLGIQSGGIVAVGPRHGRHLVPHPTTRSLVQTNSDLQPQLIPLPDDQSRMLFHIARPPSDKDTEYLVVTPGTQFQADFEPSFAIAFSEIRGFEREPLIAVLHQMRDLAHGIVVAFGNRFFS